METPKDSGWFVYMLHCNDGSMYTGIARDVERRLHEHNHDPKGAKYTKARRPVHLIHVEAADSRAAAAKREHAIKRLPAAQKAALLSARSDTGLKLSRRHIQILRKKYLA